MATFTKILIITTQYYIMFYHYNEALLIFERKIFRRIYRPKYESGECKSQTNRELEEMSEGENIVKCIKGQRISWLGHLERMEEDRMPKMIFTGRNEKGKTQ